MGDNDNDNDNNDIKIKNNNINKNNKKITIKQLYFPHSDAYKEKFPNNSSRSVSRSCRPDPLNGELPSRFNLVCIIQFLIHFVSLLLHFYMVLSFLTNFVQLSYP